MKFFQNLSYKTLFAILFFTLAGIVFFIKIGSKTEKVSAAWWDDMWHYRKAISITNSSGSNLTDFQVAVSIGTSQLIADGKMQSDCDDIRLTDINGNLLPYWIEENNPGCNSASGDTKIWLKASSLPTSGATVYIYYGNSQAVNNENGDNVFEFFDDFSTNLNKWTNITSSNWNISSGILNITPPTNDNYLVANKSIGISGFIIEGRAKANSTSTSHIGFIWHANTLTGTNHRNDQIYLRPHSYNTTNNVQPGYYSGGLGTFGNTTGLFNYNTWYNLKIEVPTSNSVKYYRDGVNENNFTNQQYQANTYTGVVAHAGANVQWDYFFIRKYASTLPTPSVQSEETGGGPIAYWKFDEGVGTTVYDSTSNLNNGVLSGSTKPTWASEDQCISGKCLKFDEGTNRVDMSTSSNNRLNFGTNEFTVGVWFKATNFSNGNCLPHPLINKGINSATGYGIGADSGSMRFWVNNTTIGYNYTDNQQWHYIVGVRTMDKIYIYDNGILKNQKDSTPLDINTATVLSIGRNYCAGGIKGLIDEVKIYPYARTADQIKQDYNSRGSLSGSSVNLGVKSNTAPSLKSSLIAHYKFDENNGTVTQSNTNPTSNISLGSSNPPTWVTGKFNKALSFGTNSVAYYASSYNSSLEYAGSNNLSYSLWINPSIAETNAGQIISKPWNGSGGYNYYLLYNRNRTLTLMIRGATAYSITTTDTLSANQWHHIGFTMDNSQNLNIYINGKLSKTGTGDISNWSVTDSNVQLAIGCIYPYTNYCNPGVTTAFNGLIDELKIYNRALTPDEIKQDYNAGSAIQFGSTTQNIGGTTTSLDYCIPGDASTCSAPVAEWNFEENTGTTVKDSSGNNNNGTISGATWTTGVSNKGSGLNFDGSNDYISISTYAYTTNATISVWVKGSYVNGNQIIVGSPNSISLGIYNVGSSKAIIGSAGISKSVGIANNFINDSWNHLTVVFDNSGNATYYCNGQLLSNSGTNSWTWSSGAYIGRRDSGTYFKGQIDQLKIYNYARTPAQIAYDYNKGAPVGWWKMDECQGSTINDSSGNNNFGTLSIGQSGTQNSIGTCQIGTSAAWTNGASGKINSSLNFDGDDDYINIINNPILNLANNNYSISIWFKSAMSMTDNPGMILQRYTGGAPGAGYWIAIQSNKVYFENRADGGDHLSITSNSSYNDHLWHQVIITVDTITKSGKMYIDGNYIKSDTYSGNILNNNANMTLGGQGSNYSFNGQLDDVRIYNYALTAEQVKQVYNGGSVSFN